jgi:hypothetical protein
MCTERRPHKPRCAAPFVFLKRAILEIMRSHINRSGKLRKADHSDRGCGAAIGCHEAASLP